MKSLFAIGILALSTSALASPEVRLVCYPVVRDTYPSECRSGCLMEGFQIFLADGVTYQHALSKVIDRRGSDSSPIAPFIYEVEHTFQLRERDGGSEIIVRTKPGRGGNSQKRASVAVFPSTLQDFSVVYRFSENKKYAATHVLSCEIR